MLCLSVGKTGLEQSMLLIVDLEATCWEMQRAPNGDSQSIHNMEIIEVGCALATRKGNLLDAHSFLVRPTRNPVLSDFCMELTGITQSMVDAAPMLPEAIEAMNAWLGDLPDDFIWCSWGNYDRLHLEAQSQLDGARPVILSHPHLNLKRIWRRTTGHKRKNGFANALAFHGLEFEGHHHRGVDDARNMARVLPYMDWSLEPELLTPPEVPV
ncbi:MAG TPA: exonuclease [Gammaproteobacteria bacterium]|nr:exonuclease domain-containing protein [Marinobacter nauticus]HBO94567.1 exonuclease [Gammaproteobacteria bacterium]